MSPSEIPAAWRLASSPLAQASSQVEGPNWRITVLTESLARVEFSPSGTFEDRATQMVLNRDFPTPEFTAERRGDGVQITTRFFELNYDGNPFSAQGLWLQSRDTGSPWGGVWRHGVNQDRLDPLTRNLGGTARTLDEVDGRCPLGNGLMHPQGYACLEDEGFAIGDDGWVTPREDGARDLYLFSRGRDYRGVLHDFYRLTGPQPLLPRWALGNWWSRFHPYSADDYLQLMDTFEAHGVPLSVGVVDMDWHITDVEPEHGSGWTGFTWNRDLFPDPAAFLASLRDRGLATSLNLHPADGIRPFEEAYRRLAQRLGIDPDSGRHIIFEPSDPEFMRAYFEEVIHPLEADGVDLWWLDWQQGAYSAMPGLDPLWMLNHLHFVDSGRDGKRPLTFSRYAGPGSHRYPVGFSGDTWISWESLEFQPEFTATSSNIGYGWWSHDIGGHLAGVHDPELTTRWVQLGCFSPVNRLHSSHNPFLHKEPWAFDEPYRSVMVEYLRLRHRLLPYLYTMNARAHFDGAPLVEPLYYDDPRAREAYTNRNQFLFGPDLLVNPLTSPVDWHTRMSPVTGWLPEGDWVDPMTGRWYRGGRTVTWHRRLSDYGLLARAGSMVVLNADEGLGTSNPEHLEVWIMGGGDGEFTLHEDDGAAQPATARTTLTWRDGMLTIGSATGDLGLPESRTWTLKVIGVQETDVEGLDTTWDARTHTLTCAVTADTSQPTALPIGARRANNDAMAWAFEVIDHAVVDAAQKEALWQRLTLASTLREQLVAMTQGGIPDSLRSALLEVFLADEA